MQGHRRLTAWQRCHELAVAVYKRCKQLPADERYVLAPQLKRAAISGSANIAEGYARRGLKDFTRFLNIALASLAEVDALLLLARDAELISQAWYDDLYARYLSASKATFGLLKSMRRPPLG